MLPSRRRGWVCTSASTPSGCSGRAPATAGQGYRLEHLPPSQRGLAIHDVEAAETPILLVHGMVDNRSIFTVLRRGLVRRGFGQIETMNYSILTGDIRAAAARLGAEVERIVEETGYERIHVIGHSMGGLIARYYVTRLGGDAHVHTLVTLGTPHHGSYLAYGWNNGLTRQLRPGSALMEELAGPVTDCQTRFIVYWSDLDQVVVPQRNAALHHEDLNVHNIALHGVGPHEPAHHQHRRARHLDGPRPPRHVGRHRHPGRQRPAAPGALPPRRPVAVATRRSPARPDRRPRAGRLRTTATRLGESAKKRLKIRVAKSVRGPRGCPSVEPSRGPLQRDGGPPAFVTRFCDNEIGHVTFGARSR